MFTKLQLCGEIFKSSQFDWRLWNAVSAPDCVEEFYIKIILTKVSADLATNSLLPCFRSLLQTENKNQVFSKLVVWLQEILYFWFLF